MRSAQYSTITAAFLLFFCQLTLPSFSQLGTSFDIKKPKEFENRVLRSEKSDQKKFKGPKKFIQNTISHYNYFFNANNKLNEVLQRAKASFTDDYSQLIPFYNYSLDMTAADTVQLDSIKYKTQTGIILHDLRSDWADNLYLIWGTVYYLKKEFDSAYLMFQFINYAFAEKEKDGYYKVIGSSRDGNSAMSISTKEKNGVLSRPPSRNDAFIWQIRNYLAQDRFSSAASLVQALKNDPEFPDRLQNDLEEVQAYSFYKQQMWDSAAAHLEKALSNATTKQERARWEYLLGQLYESTKHFEQAESWYSKSINNTTDPILDIYARLASVRVNKDSSENYVDKNIASLLRMAKRDKYHDYRDIIYYMAGQMELERNNIDNALAMLLKSSSYPTNNQSQRNKVFLQLAELSFAKRFYRQSSNFYDSLNLSDPSLKNRAAEINSRKAILARLADNIEVEERQDSLQALVALPEAERKDKVRKLARQLRKQQGLKEETTLTTGSTRTSTTAPTLFFAETDKKAEWYFYNASTRQKGLADFKAKWGNRPNTDNWRRSAALSASIPGRTSTNAPPQLRQGTDILENEQREITFEGLYAGLPLTPEKLQQSNDSIQNALFNQGMIYVQELEDCASGIETFEKLKEHFPQHPKMDQALFNLYYCYQKNGQTAKASQIKQLLNKQYPSSNSTAIINTGKDPMSKGPKPEATRTYEQIYDLFIEGSFAEAIAQKRKADSLYGKNYWTPQLLYIESVYYIKKREDSTAKVVLNNIIGQFKGTPIASKAVTMLDVLNRRQQIEEELRNMVITMPAEDTTTRRPAPTPVIQKEVVPPPVRKDSVAAIQQKTQAPVINVPKTTIDSSVVKAVPPPPAMAYSFDAETPHFVVLTLNKVDPIFINEARNAFFRYNKETYYNKTMQAELVEIDSDNRLLLISPFKNAADALAYVEQTRPKTSTEIIPWLKGGKYSYSIITEKNLEILKNSKELDKYRQFLEKNMPGKF